MTTIDYAPRRLARLPVPAPQPDADEPVAPRRFAPIRSAFARDVLAGLSRPRKSIPFGWLHDRAGAQLLERIALRDAYYPAQA